MLRLLLAVFVIGWLTPTESRAELLPGSYPLPPARMSQTWSQANNASHGVDDVINIQSWDGTEFGQQWSLTCGHQGTEQQVRGWSDGTGSSMLVRQNRFTGGQLRLNLAPFGILELPLENVTTTDSTWSTGFSSYCLVHLEAEGGPLGQAVIRLVITNAPAVSSDELVVLGGYPPFLNPGCQPMPDHPYGIWADVNTATLVIDQPVPSRPITWGNLKASYR